MTENERFTVPGRLDDPERWLFWTLDEAAALLGPAVLGLAANAFVAGLVTGVGAWLALRRVMALHAVYWFLPGFVLRLRGTPESHLRRFAG